MESVRTDVLPPGFRLDETRVNNVDPVEESNTNSLLAIQPLVICLRFLGVELDPSILNESSTTKSKCYRYRTLFIGLFFLLLNGFCTILTAVIEHNEFTKIYSNEIMLSTANGSTVDAGRDNSTIPPVFSWNLIVDYVNYGVLVLGVHLTLFLFPHQEKWKLLWNNVKEILQHHNEFIVVRKSIRRLTIAGIVDIGLVIRNKSF